MYDDDRLKARPYLITAGRTRSEFPLEAMVVGRRPVDGELRHERRAIVETVDNPMALAELSHRLSLPLGVVRVLVEELSEEGWVDIHTESTTADDLDLVFDAAVRYPEPVVRDALSISDHVPIVEIDARNRASSKTALLTLLDVLLKAKQQPAGPAQ